MPNPKKKFNGQNLTVITTHVNADFDALASMLAAQKLYPEALVVFPGSQEKNLKNFFISSLVYLFNMVDITDINFLGIKRLVALQRSSESRDIWRHVWVSKRAVLRVGICRRDICDHSPKAGTRATKK